MAEPTLRAFLRGDIDAANFRHADHVRMGFEILQHHDFPEAAVAFARSLKQIAVRAGAPGKYHETITLAFLSLIAERQATGTHRDFESFAAANPDLMETSVLKRWYAPERLMSDVARKIFVLPDMRR
ncbi:MAG TPA: hypothetical protein VLC29_03300 [Rhizomicrobium sp.]|jgi:hypothetical protein|nr:hypothetical protein [Rhizomicrobium sp.]